MIQLMDEIKNRMAWMAMEDMQEAHPYREFGWYGFIMFAFDRSILMSDEINLGEYL